jgi:hypothetical protein
MWLCTRRKYTNRRDCTYHLLEESMVALCCHLHWTARLDEDERERAMNCRGVTASMGWGFESGGGGGGWERRRLREAADDSGVAGGGWERRRRRWRGLGLGCGWERRLLGGKEILRFPPTLEGICTMATDWMDRTVCSGGPDIWPAQFSNGGLDRPSNFFSSFFLFQTTFDIICR